MHKLSGKSKYLKKTSEAQFEREILHYQELIMVLKAKQLNEVQIEAIRLRYEDAQKEREALNEPIYKKIEQITSNSKFYDYPSLFRKTFIENTPPKLNARAQQEVDLLQLRLAKLPDDVPYFPFVIKDQENFKKEIARYVSVINRLSYGLAIKQEERKKKEAKAAAQQRLKERAKNNEQEKRAIAASLRGRLTNKICPYCAVELDVVDVHADHIYPVSKGGLSTIQNMVLVCSACNLKKRDLTWLAFVKKFTLDRHAIEKRLEEFEKDF